MSVRHKKNTEKLSLPLSSKAEKGAEIMDLTVDDDKTDDQCYENTTFIGGYVVFAF